MNKFVVVVDKLEDWRPYFPSDQVITVKEYLFGSDYQQDKKLQIINLSYKLEYLSLGYYCSLLAEARGHKIIPNLKTINDLSKKNLYVKDLDELQIISNKMMDIFVTKSIEIKKFNFRIYFGKSTIKTLENLVREIFEFYPCPILDVTIEKKKVWQVTSIAPVSIKDLEESEESFFADSLDQFSTKIWRRPKKLKSYVFDIGILVNPEEKMPPSNKKALKKIMDACERNDVYAEMITRKDFSRINEFDGLFIRETTAINNHTYRFSKFAASEGLVVVDDPQSILKCTNKIFMSNLFHRIGISSIPGMFVSDIKKKTLDTLEITYGYPLVVKIPDGSHSVGISKVNNKKELIEKLNDMFKKSDLILVQKFLYTKYDWRIGVLGKEALFACKYFMSENHWQIYNHQKDQASDEFCGEAITMDVKDVPEKILKVALKACSAIGNGLYGVDLKEDEEGNVFVVEVNDNPNIDFGIEDKIYGDKLYDKLVQWFVSEMRKKKES